MNSPKQTARLAGLFFLLSAIVGGFGYSYIRLTVLVPDNATATAANIMTAEIWFRAAIVASLLSQVFLFFFGLTLFRLFKDVHRRLAIVFVASIMMTVGIAVINQLNNLAVLLVLSPVEYLKVFTPEQLKALAMMFLRLSGLGQGLLEIFWTPYFVAWGLLAIKSKYFPQILGILLIIMGTGYSVNLLDKFLVPTFHPVFFTQLAMSLGALGGIPSILWLLIKGARVPANHGATSQ
jgi:uncharacterized protein DUF4386